MAVPGAVKMRVDILLWYKISFHVDVDISLLFDIIGCEFSNVLLER